jgi:hypothetical protein
LLVQDKSGFTQPQAKSGTTFAAYEKSKENWILSPADCILEA